jgi:Phosphotransferase enzyme family
MLTDFAIAKTQRAISRASSIQPGNHDQEGHKQQHAHIRVLENLRNLISILASHPVIQRSSPAVLWHSDLHLGNIFVSTDDPTVIEGIIDWQSCLVAPLFLQCRVPVFLDPPYDYVPGTTSPKLPDNYSQLNTIQQQRAVLERDLATRWKMYEMFTLVNNPDVHHALALDRRLWEPFARCGESSSDSILPLRSSLVRLSKDWASLGFAGKCPLTFSTSELEEHEGEAIRHRDRVYLRSLVREQLGTDDEGWVPIHEWDSVRAENQRLLGLFIETMADEMPREEAVKLWPFCDQVG